MERTVIYKGEAIGVRGGQWLDIMNSWLYTEIEDVRLPNKRGELYSGTICREREIDGGALFFLTRYVDSF